MPMIIKNNVRYCSTGGDAESIVYNNTESGMEATNMQDAIDELNSNIDNQNKKFTDYDVILNQESVVNNKTYTLPKDIKTYKRIAIKLKCNYSTSDDIFYITKEFTTEMINKNEIYQLVELVYDSTHKLRTSILFPSMSEMRMIHSQTGYGIQSIIMCGFYA